MFKFFIYHKYLNNLLMKNYILLSTILFMSTPLSVSAYTANQIASTGKCWIAINHSDESVSDFGGRMGNVPFDVRGNYDIAVDADGNLNEPVVTGLDNIYGDVKGNVMVDGTTVTLSNTADKGMIATTTGTIVYQGGDATVDLAPGVYVVRAGSYVGKIIIR